MQPDVTKVGEISESRRIAWIAQENGARYIPHGWNTAVGVAADLQQASAFVDTDLVEPPMWMKLLPEAGRLMRMGCCRSRINLDWGLIWTRMGWPDIPAGN